MTIYLYVKTHRKTGLKYLGKTNAKDPHKYPGSGVYWSSHLAKHGNDVATEILRECTTNEEVKEYGIYYSGLWDVVGAVDDSGKKIWANLKPEEGAGGAFKPSQESIAKGLATRKANGKLNSTSPESITKGLETRKANGKLNTQTPESIAKGIATRKANGTKVSRESIDKCLATKRANGTLNTSNPDSATKRLATMRANGTNKQTPESIAKMLATRARNKAKL